MRSLGCSLHTSGHTGSTKAVRASADDLLLVRRLLERDDAAFESLVERYHGALLRLARVFVGDRAVAEEVVQDTWIGVLNGLGSFEGRSSLKTWIFSILTHKAKTRGARERRSIPFSNLLHSDAADDAAVSPARFAPDGTWIAASVRWDEYTPERLLLSRESRAYVEAALEELPPSQRAVVTLRDVEGLDAADACHVLHISEINQRVLLHRGRARLRAALERYLSEIPGTVPVRAPAHQPAPAEKREERSDLTPPHPVHVPTEWKRSRQRSEAVN